MIDQKDAVGIILYHTAKVLKEGHAAHGIHGYTYRPMPEQPKQPYTAMARYTYTDYGYKIKSAIKEDQTVVEPIDIIELEFITTDEVDRDTMCDAINRMITKEVSGKLPTKIATNKIKKNLLVDTDTIVWGNLPVTPKFIASDIAEISANIAVRTKPALSKPNIFIYDPAIFFKEKRSRPDYHFMSKCIYHNELPRNELYMANVKEIDEIGKTADDVSYAVVISKDPEADIWGDRTEIYRQEFLKFNKYLVLDNLAAWGPKLLNLLERRGPEAISINRGVINVGNAKNDSGRLITFPLLLHRAIRGLEDMSARLKAFTASPDDFEYLDITDKIEKLTNQRKTITIPIGSAKVQLRVGYNMGSYNDNRRFIKSGCRILLVGFTNPTGGMIYNTVVRCEDADVIIAATYSDSYPI